MRGSVLISGASVAGPALACWLGRCGFEVTVVEIAPALRSGGAAVDFRGDLHLAVLERMGVLADLQEVRTGGSPMTFVDERERPLLELPAEFAGGALEVLRGDLARVLHAHSADVAEYVFGDHVVDLRDTPDGVEVTFASGANRLFDLVIGADGVHSGVRRLAFGPEELFISHLGYYVATWDLPRYRELPPGSVGHNQPGRFISVGADRRDPGRAGAFAIFKSPRLDYDRHDVVRQRALIAQAFAGVGWEAPRLLAGLESADDLFFDSINRVDVESWSRGRIALLGDAACGATLGGMGTGAAVIAAYVLAGELVAANGDHRAAFARYEAKVRPYAQACQGGGGRTGKFLAPGRFGARARNAMLGNGFLLRQMLKMGEDLSTGIDLPDYDLTFVTGSGA
ncbi:2-polyprenyl-6-methoxyphenol hydroxylase [Saccharopolyspora kobensis]|uniref:2-polyprenyl-6-methoxyphenol hydroxylase n=1 Tax=Saccharopolyspora kobensis TaxID=146035 RepID=A0A1H6EH56_9PSEU|nr:FAD-dependent monooxygenase [Saccharopolyspora kobensis]SEG96114.1 2-polyprenyl-6-methoxyphenol hydroxylase [Saccharopolyspora kobensis]SFD22092.1 2-polyprenyl-6-methoxyphenol hydroxylase [Saccharopolyspora kobensis]